MWALRQTFLLNPATKVAVEWSVVEPTTNFIIVIKSTNVYICIYIYIYVCMYIYIYIKYVSSRY